MTIFLTSFLGCLAAILLWKRFEKRRANPIEPIKPIVVHTVFDKSRKGESNFSTAYIDPNTRRFKITSRFETASGVRIYDYRFINGAVYVRLVDDYDDSDRYPRTLLYDVYEGFILEEDFRARRAKGLNPERADEEIEYMKAEIVWHRLSPDAFNSISSILEKGKP